MSGVNHVVRASPPAFVAGQMALCFQTAKGSTNRSFILAGAFGYCGNRGPAMCARVIRLIGKSEQHQLFAGGKV